MDLLITDIDMPGQSGFELAAALSAKQPNLPVLFMTGGTIDDMGFERKKRTILQKPFTARRLLASIDQMLGANYHESSIEEAGRSPNLTA